MNGGSAGLLRCGKGTTWEGGVRVPAMVRWPAGRIGCGGGKENGLFASVDLVPTLLRLANVTVPQGLHGRDQSELLIGKGKVTGGIHND